MENHTEEILICDSMYLRSQILIFPVHKQLRNNLINISTDHAAK